MARQKGMLNLSGNLEPLAGAPLDSRTITPTVADLYIASNWPYKYIGMKTTVTATGDTYRLVNLDVTQESSWVLDGGSGGQTIQYDELPAASSSLEGKIYQYTGATNLLYTNGYFYECVNDGGTYKWVQTNVQPSSGGGGGGHTIQEDGTDMTSRASLNFVGMDVSDNSEDDSTDVEEHRLTSAEISEIMGGIPNPQPRYPVIFDERGTEYQVGWYILANGTKKPVYEKTVYISSLPNNGNGNYAHDISNMDKCVDAFGFFIDVYEGVTTYHYPNYATKYGVQYSISVDVDRTNIMVCTGSDRSAWSGYITLRYTKTTDTPV